MQNECVLDASAVLAVLLAEPGADKVTGRLEDACLCTVNAAEVGDKLSRIGERIDIEQALKELEVEIIPTDFSLALDAAALFMPTRIAGLSLGDRFCLALAKRLGRPAITSDRHWMDIADAVGVRVELIR